MNLNEKFLRYCMISKDAGRLEKGNTVKYNGVEYGVVSKFESTPKGFLKDSCQGNVLAKTVDGEIDKYLVTFQGSTYAIDWIHDFFCWQVDWPFYKIQKDTAGVKIHRGFVDYYCSVRDKVIREVSDIVSVYKPKGIVPEITFCGHSLGGALTSIAILDCKELFGSDIKVSGYTFGSPRVYNNKGADLVNSKVDYLSRVTNKDDLVPNLPGTVFYCHVGALYHIMKDLSISDKAYYIFPLFASIPDHLVQNYVNVIRTIINVK